MIPLPEVAVLELTYRCNHRCFFCSCPWEAEESYRLQEMPFSEWQLVVDTLMANGVKTFTLTGGEPLMREDLKDLLRYLAGKGASVNLISNGRAIDDSFLDFLAMWQIPLSVSMPGLRTFHEHTGVDNVSHVLSLYAKAHARGVTVNANIAVTKKNLPELYETIAYALLNGADYVLLNRFLPGGRGLSNEEYLLTREEVNEMLDIAEEVLSKAGRYGHVGTELPLCAIDHPERYEHIRVSNLCAAAKGFFVVDPSGYLKVCNHSPTRLCRYDALEKLRDHPYWKAFQGRDYLPDACRDCDKKVLCDGGCREAAHVFSGSYTDPDPIFDEG